MQCAENKVACLGRVNGGFKGVDVPQLADEDHIGILPHGVFEGFVPISAIQADFPLVRRLRDLSVDLVHARADPDAGKVALSFLCVHGRHERRGHEKQGQEAGEALEHGRLSGFGGAAAWREAIKKRSVERFFS